MLAFAAVPQCWSTETVSVGTVNSDSPNASTVVSMREKNAGSTEMYSVLKKMKTVLKRVNSTAFEIYFFCLSSKT